MQKSMPIFQPRNLLVARKRAFKTQEQMAKAVGVTLRGYQRWERGESPPQPQNALALADVLGIEPLDLYESEEIPA